MSVPEAGSGESSEQIAVATGSCVALCSPVKETKNSGSPSGNSADVQNVSEKLPASVPEEGSVRSISEKENAVKGLGTLPYPVTESNHPKLPRKIQLTLLIALGDCHIGFLKKIKNRNWAN